MTTAAGTATAPRTTEAGAGPDVSFIMPCYNEEEVLDYTIPNLFRAFGDRGHRLELVAIDNGSSDSTGAVIARLQENLPGIVTKRVSPNEGYGNGILQGIPLCTAPWIGIIPADGQVDAEDVVRLFDAAIATRGRVLAKVRRRFRMDGPLRKVVSTSYNLFVRMLWPGLASIDVNGSPKLLPADVMRSMKLESKGWLLDPEIMVKAHSMGIRVLELNVFARMRGAGLSHVRASTAWEFFHQLVMFKLTSRWQPADRASKSDTTTAPR